QAQASRFRRLFDSECDEIGSRNKHNRHPEGERDAVALASRRMATRTEIASTLRDGRAQARATSSGTSEFVAPYSAARRSAAAGLGSRRAARHSSNRCTSTKNDGTNTTAKQVEAI